MIGEKEALFLGKAQNTILRTILRNAKKEEKLMLQNVPYISKPISSFDFKY